MPADASIYSLLRPAQPLEGPMDRYAKGMQLKALIGQDDLQALQLEQLKRGIAEDEETRSAYRESGGDPNKLRDILFGKGLFKPAMAAEKAGLDRQKAMAEVVKTDRENFVAFASDAKNRLPTVTPETWGAYRDEQLQRASMFQTPEVRNAAVRAAQSLPVQFDPNFIRNSLVKAEELFTPKLVERTDGQKKWMEDTNPFTNPAILRGSSTQMQTTPGERLSDATTRRGQNMTDARGRDLAQATRDAATTGRIPPGYRQTAGGNLEAIPGGPHDTKVGDKAVEQKKTLDAYVAARDGLMSGLERSNTGAVSGRIPAVTSAQQVAEGGVAAMGPVLKQLFRVAGEGVFTDRDQALLMDMVPKRTDNLDAAEEKMLNIDRIVAAKMGMPVPARVKKQETKGPIAPPPGGVDPSTLSDAELKRELGI